MLVAIEGVDGVGKTHQLNAIRKALSDRNIVVASVSFPRYDATPSGHLIGKYLNGDFGDLNPYVAASLYAADRQQSADFLDALLSHSDVVLVDRYVDSNIAHQCARLPDGPARVALKQWVELFEYTTNRLKRPDLTIILDVPIELAVERIAKKSGRTYTDKAADKHEADVPYLRQVQGLYKSMRRSGVTHIDNTVSEKATLDCVSAIRLTMRNCKFDKLLINKM